MKRASVKKGTDTKKKAKSPPRNSRSSTAKATAKSKTEQCFYCAKPLETEDRVLFVEEEVGRIFCKEACIAAFFSPEIDRFEKEFQKHLTSRDLDSEERESLSHLRWITLQEPDEIWREKTLAGDYRYTLISEFQPGDRRIWCVCLCLFLRGEPSFLYLSFPTNDPALMNIYRRGERMEWIRKPTASSAANKMTGSGSSTGDAADPEPANPEQMMDRLADEWTEDETVLAQLTQEREADDIPPEEFNLYQRCLEETLEEPDEVWSSRSGEEGEESDSSLRMFHFIRHYANETPEVWYVIVARETDEEEQIEILDAFPTRDANLVDRYRRGDQEVGILEQRHQASRMIH